MIATDIAEIKNQISDEEGKLAGELLHLVNGEIDVEELADAILKVANDEEYYQILKIRTLSAARKFNISNVTDSYLGLYMQIFKENPIIP